jgi:hypothetical protein
MMRDKIREDVRLRLTERGYDQYPAEEGMFDELVEAITASVMRVVKAL